MFCGWGDEMSETLLIAAAGYVVTLLVAVGGWVFGYRMQSEARRLSRLEKKVNQLESEARARIALEKAACEWLAELTKRSPEAVKRDLRSRGQERSGLRPKMSDSDLPS